MFAKKLLAFQLLCLLFAGYVFTTCTREIAQDVTSLDDQLIKQVKSASPNGDVRDYILVSGENLAEIPISTMHLKSCSRFM